MCGGDDRCLSGGDVRKRKEFGVGEVCLNSQVARMSSDPEDLERSRTFPEVGSQKGADMSYSPRNA